MTSHFLIKILFVLSFNALIFSSVNANSTTLWNIKQIEYGHKLLNMSFLSAESTKIFRLIYTSQQLEDLELSKIHLEDQNSNEASPMDQRDLLLLNDYAQTLKDELENTPTPENQKNKLEVLWILEKIIDQHNLWFQLIKKESSYTPICGSYHQVLTSFYTKKNRKIWVSTLIGDKKTQCYGRCGSRCGSRSKYTLECLGHDLCHRIEGQQMGVCKDEFWAASKGYLWAPNCNSK